MLATHARRERVVSCSLSPRGKTAPPPLRWRSPASVGVCRALVSRLVIIGGLPIAVRVLIADAARDGCGAVLPLSLIARLIGRGDTTRSCR